MVAEKAKTKPTVEELLAKARKPAQLAVAHAQVLRGQDAGHAQMLHHKLRTILQSGTLPALRFHAGKSKPTPTNRLN